MPYIINIFLDTSLTLMLVPVALLLLKSNDNLTTVILSSLFSLILCMLYVVLDAVDVAFTEAAVGTGISSILFFLTIKRIETTNQAPDKQQPTFKWPSGFAILFSTVMVLLLVFGTLDMPFYGDPNTPIHHYLTPRFLYQSSEEIDIPNIVTAVLASYRGYDTLGEVVVIFIAGITVFLLLSGNGKNSHKNQQIHLISNLILKTTLIRIIPLVLLFSLYVQFHGEYGPGGGFQAGVIFSAALITFGLLTTREDLTAIISQKWINIFATLGGLIYAGVGVFSLVMGGEFLNYSVLGSTPTGGQHLGIIIIELGVGITVAFTMLSLFINFTNHTRGK